MELLIATLNWVSRSSKSSRKEGGREGGGKQDELKIRKFDFI